MSKKKQKQKNVTVEVVSLNSTVIEKNEVSGWSDNAEKVEVKGQVAEIILRKDKDLVLILRILEDGTLILTNCGFYTTFAPQQTRFTNDRPWKD